jgi:DNA polymerase-1
MPANGPLVLVDGSSYLYRAFHALPPLSNSRGEPTGAVYGVVNMLLKLLKEQQPRYVAVLFDARGRTFRDDIYAQYKAQRTPMPDELVRQIEPLHAVVRALGLPLIQMEGVEADDVIGTLAMRASERGIDTVISTIDKDMAQIVGDRVTLVNTMFDTRLDRAGVRAKFGVEPEQIVDYLALVGDTSDNIPGVPGVGPKTAAALLQRFGTLDGVFENLDRVGEAGVRGAARVAESLREHRDEAMLSRALARIRCDLELDLTPEQLVRAEPDHERLRALYRSLEFGTLLRQLPPPGVPAPDAGPVDGAGDASVTARPAVATRYETILDEESLQRWIGRLEAADAFAFAAQRTRHDYMRAEIVGVSFATTAGEAAYVPVAHNYPGAPTQLARALVLEKLRPLLESETRAKIGHDLKFTVHALANHGIEMRGPRFDTMLESYVLDATATRHDLASIALKYLGHETVPYEAVAGKGARQIGFEEVALEQAGPYAAADADVALRLHEALWKRLAEVPALQKLYLEIEAPLASVLEHMERAGVLVDAAMLKQQSQELARKLAEIEQQVEIEAGRRFNLGSPKQLQEVLYEHLGLPVLRKTATGQPSTAEDVLEELAESYTLPRLILDHRALIKLKSTYTDNLPRQINPRTGRVHTCYNQAVAITGRLSSADPNLQNIPVRRGEGRRIRAAFVAPPGSRLLAADYSQIELRIMAHLSGDEGLLKAFRDGGDIHRATAAEVFAVPLEHVTPDQRRAAKVINFGLIYGMSAFGLARQLGIERGAAQAYVDLYFQRYPGVKAFMDRTRRQARERGYVETVFGRRLYLTEINSRNAQRRQYAERSAINAPMQGTAADIIKRAMIAIDRWLASRRFAARLIMQVHDELVLEVPTEELEDVRAGVCERMIGAAELSVPLEVDAKSGANWDEAH